jgi:hypothetical protein
VKGRAARNAQWSSRAAARAGGKRGRRIDASDAAIRTGEAELAVLVLEVRRGRRTYFDRVAADARLVLRTSFATSPRGCEMPRSNGSMPAAARGWSWYSHS